MTASCACGSKLRPDEAGLLANSTDELMERTIAAMQSFAPDRDTFTPAQ